MAFRLDGTLRPIPDDAESMVCRLKRLDESAGESETADIIRHTLRQFCEDLQLFENSGVSQQLCGSEQNEVFGAWLSFRKSAHSWAKIANVIHETGESRFLAPAILRELYDDKDRYLADLADYPGRNVLANAHRVASFLRESSALFEGEGAAFLPEIAQRLYETERLSSAEYLQHLGAYLRAPGARLDTFVACLNSAAEALFLPLDWQAERLLKELRQSLVAIVGQMTPQEIQELYSLPAESVVFLAPAIISRVGDEIAQGPSDRLFEDLCHHLQVNFLSLPPRANLAAKSAVLEALLTEAAELPTPRLAHLVERLAPFLVAVDWTSQGAQVLWSLLSDSRTKEFCSVQGAIMNAILASDELTTSFCGWCADQSKVACFFRGQPYPHAAFFEIRSYVVASQLAQVFSARKDFGRELVPDQVCLRALSIASSLRDYARGIVPEIAALSGRLVVSLPFFGLTVVPTLFHRPQDPCQEVVKASECLFDRFLGKRSNGEG